MLVPHPIHNKEWIKAIQLFTAALEFCVHGLRVVAVDSAPSAAGGGALRPAPPATTLGAETIGQQNCGNVMFPQVINAYETAVGVSAENPESEAGLAEGVLDLNLEHVLRPLHAAGLHFCRLIQCNDLPVELEAAFDEETAWCARHRLPQEAVRLLIRLELV